MTDLNLLAKVCVWGAAICYSVAAVAAVGMVLSR